MKTSPRIHKLGARIYRYPFLFHQKYSDDVPYLDTGDQNMIRSYLSQIDRYYTCVAYQGARLFAMGPSTVQYRRAFYSGDEERLDVIENYILFYELQQ